MATANEGATKGTKWSKSQLACRELHGTFHRSIMIKFYMGLKDDKNQTVSARIYIETHLKVICTLIWGVHVGTRTALVQRNDFWINRVIVDFGMGKVPDWTNFRDCVKAYLPADKMAGVPRNEGGGSRGKRKSQAATQVRKAFSPQASRRLGQTM